MARTERRCRWTFAPPAERRPAESGLAQRPADNPLPLAFSFLSYGDRRIELLALDPRRTGRAFGSREGIGAGMSTLRRRRDEVLVSSELAAGTGLGRRDRIELPTPAGKQELRIAGTVEDISWPSGTVYMDIARYRKLYRTSAVNMLVVDRMSRLRRQRLDSLRPLHAVSGRTEVERIRAEMDRVSQSFLAMRFLTLIAALVAVGGILATSVFARRREWGELRAMGMSADGLLRSLALEVLLIMVVGAVCGVVGGIVSFRGPVLAFMEGQGYSIGGELVAGTLLTVAGGAVVVGTLAVVVPTWLTARTPLADALGYE